MNREELRQAILSPAVMVSVTFEPSLVDTLLDDIEEY